MNQSKVRLIIDILLVALLVFEMLYLVTGNALHEIFGVAFFATVGAHLILTRRMTGALLKRAQTPKRTGNSLPAIGKLRLALALLLAVDGVILVISSAAVSNLLMAAGFGLASGDAYEMWALIHIGSAYALCGLVVFHAAAHWATFLKGSSIPYNPARRQAIQSWVMGGATIGAVVLGFTSVVPLSSRLNNVFASEVDGPQTTHSSGSEGSDQGGASSQYQPSDSGFTGEAEGSSQRSQSISGNNRGYERGPNGYSGGTGRTYGDSNPNSRNGNDTSSGSDGSSNEPSRSGGSGDSSASNLCTLCPKRCSLSSPRCNRPYAAGLL